MFLMDLSGYVEVMVRRSDILRLLAFNYFLVVISVEFHVFASIKVSIQQSFSAGRKMQ